ncbi:hypothetical protein TTHERM_01079100 (macronuclear) [Tetrahymena thermophila SB210]|uniref:Uncharacterized protein n=1 Tax=Tetrahymena thermophila (strain SB210) TaxID=312017 RepID=Q24CE1_TETTS|nr:hypothetical protein TTHERM_01079100 [Tetrahymena thermophila SB210]EAS05433.1 hypothetical protein TTHERM_01079100 [Tetrahymena thermophila SB210]|eukprot:XP_001025678.1 hypothetical protein TTHERM_01079100 [Tetrahymena thermophila SB210]
MNTNNQLLKPILHVAQSSSDYSKINNMSGANNSNSYHKIAANLFTNQLQSQQQQQQLQQQQQQQQYLYSSPQTIQKKILQQQSDSSRQPQNFLYESVDYKIATQSSAQNSPFHIQPINSYQAGALSQSNNGGCRNQSPYSGNNSYLFSNNNNTSSQQQNINQNLLFDKTASLMKQNSSNQQNMQISATPSISNINYLNSSMNQGQAKCHSATSIHFELRDLQQERFQVKMMTNYSGTEENSPMQARIADRFNLHKQRDVSKGRQNSEDQNKKIHQSINELEGEWNKLKQIHNLDNRSQSPFNNSLNNSALNIAKTNNLQAGQQRLSDQLNRDQWNTQVSDNCSVHDQSYDNTIKTQGSIKSLTSSCKRIRTQGDSTNNGSNNSLKQIVHTPSRKQKDQSASSIKKTQIINKSIPLTKINLDQMRTNSYSSRSQGEQVTQYIVKKDSRQNSSQISNRNSLNNSNSLISTNTNNPNSNHVQNKSPISRNSSQDEFAAPKSPDTTFLKIQEKYQNVHKQKTGSKHQDSSNQSINLSQNQQNNSQYQVYNNQQQLSTNYSQNMLNLNQQNQETNANSNQQYQKNSFSDLSVSPYQSQIMSHHSSNMIGSNTLHQYPSIISQSSAYQANQAPQVQQPSSYPLPLKRYSSLQNDLTNNFNNQNNNIYINNSQDQSDIFHFNTQASGASPFNNNNIINNQLKSPASYRSSNQQSISIQQNSNTPQYNNNISNNYDSNNGNNSALRQLHQNTIKINEQTNQINQVPHSMQTINQLQNAQSMNYLITQNYAANNPSTRVSNAYQISKSGQHSNRQSEQSQIQQQFGENQNRILQQTASPPGGFSDALSQVNQKNQIPNSKEKSIIQPVRASPVKKMISDVKPQYQSQQSPKQNGLVKGIQGSNCYSNNNNNSLGTYSSNTYNLSYTPQMNASSQQNAYQISGKKDMTQIIMNKIKKMNVARISLNEDDDLLFQSTDAESYSNLTNGSNKNYINAKGKANSKMVDMKSMNGNNNNNDYLQSLQIQEIDHIQKTIQQQQMKSKQDYIYQLSDNQANNIEVFSTNSQAMHLTDTVSPRSVPSQIQQMTNDPTKISYKTNILSNQKYFITNEANDKNIPQKSQEEVYRDLMMYKQKSNISPVKQNQISQNQLENNTATSSFLNSNGQQVKESFIQSQTQKPYIISQNNLQLTPINQKKVSSNTNYSQKLLDSIQKHSRIHKENQQNIYSNIQKI